LLARFKGKPYQGIAEERSVLILTILEIWMILDQCAISLYPLLKEFNTGIPLDIFQSLLLIRRQDMHRVHIIETHLQQRDEWAHSSQSTIFAHPNENCYAVKCIDTVMDEDIQATYHTISDVAALRRKAKTEEWQSKTDKYDALSKQILAASCDKIWKMDDDDVERETKEHRPDCAKCKLSLTAEAMSIDIWEDLLPEDISQAKCVIFELRRPTSFALYRDLTWQVRTALLEHFVSVSVDVKRCFLREYTPLQKFMNGDGRRDIALASTTKSFYKTHYRSILMNTNPSIESILLPHGHSYSYYDQMSGQFTGRLKVRAIRSDSSDYRTIHNWT
jgi:hypothetical protein